MNELYCIIILVRFFYISIIYINNIYHLKINKFKELIDANDILVIDVRDYDYN